MRTDAWVAQWIERLPPDNSMEVYEQFGPLLCGKGLLVSATNPLPCFTAT